MEPHLKRIWMERLCGCFPLVNSLSDILLLESPEWAQINNLEKEESVSWTLLISAACNTHNVFKSISSLPLQTPVQKANRTQLLKPKDIKWVRFGCALQVLCPASYFCRYWTINTAGINTAQPRERGKLASTCTINGKTYEKRSCWRWEREDLVRLFIHVTASMMHFFVFYWSILSLEATLVMHPTAPWEVLHLPGYITLAALFPTALWESVLSVHTDSHTSEIHFR